MSKTETTRLKSHSHQGYIWMADFIGRSNSRHMFLLRVLLSLKYQG